MAIRIHPAEFRSPVLAGGSGPDARGRWRAGPFRLPFSWLGGILEYAIATNDDRIVEFVRRGYEYGCMFAIPRIGWTPTGGPKHFDGDVGGL